ncbi:uncharacterized protein LOC120072546 isoform X1 [Benincasa hispida]|uniref:uncharacterized protein LOC120072546 isoform X1 n=1 Tax=Benincasa hispida TaxID=102211 RepID=UPI0019015F58|nr:uncharacterized protein LOC120072546 isoform X1 [Benincasa hispida]
MATSFTTPFFPTFKIPLISPPPFPINAISPLRTPFRPLASSAPPQSSAKPLKIPHPSDFRTIEATPSGKSRFLIIGAVSVGVALFLIGCDGERALALGPEGPLVEEFWDNVRRYAIYALTVRVEIYRRWRSEDHDRATRTSFYVSAS